MEMIVALVWRRSVSAVGTPRPRFEEEADRFQEEAKRDAGRVRAVQKCTRQRSLAKEVVIRESRPHIIRKSIKKILQS